MAWLSPRRIPVSDNIANVYKVGDPALCVSDDGTLHCLVYDGVKHRVRHLINARGGAGDWSEGSRPPKLRIMGGIETTWHNGALHLIYMFSSQINHAVFDGRRWRDLGKVEGQITRFVPSLGSDGTDLHMVHKGFKSNRVYHSRLNGNGWTDAVWLNRLATYHAPAFGQASGRLHLFATDLSRRIRMTEFDPRTGRWSGIETVPNQKMTGERMCVAIRPNANQLYLARTSDPSPTLAVSTLTGERVMAPGQAVISRRRYGVWSPHGPIGEVHSNSVPAVAATRSGLHAIYRAGDDKLWYTFQRGWHIGEIRIGVKVASQVARNFGGTDLQRRVRNLVNQTNAIFDPMGIRVTQATPAEEIELPNSLLTVNAPSCTPGDLPFPIEWIFRSRNGLRRDDIAIYVIRDVQLDGSAGTQGVAFRSESAVILDQGTTAMIFAHEIGHILGLPHVGSRTNLMFRAAAGGTALTRVQGARMLADGNVR